MQNLATLDTGSETHDTTLVRDAGNLWLRWRGPSIWRQHIERLYQCRPLPALPLAPSSSADDELLARLPTPEFESLEIWKWRNLPRIKALDSLTQLAITLRTIHDAGFCLQGLRRNELFFHFNTGALLIASLPRLTPLIDHESIWRDLRLFGELAFENFLNQEYPGGHRLVEILQNRSAMKDLGLTIPGLPQVLAGCVTPYGDLAFAHADELLAALELLRREISPSLHFRVGSRSTLGNHIFRQNNQDSCGHVLMNTTTGSHPHPLGFFCVADGIGGIQDGEKASALAIKTSCATFLRAWEHYPPDYLHEHPTAFALAIARITSQRLALEGEFSPAKNRGGTTFTSLFLAGNRAGLAHIGDSRATLIRDRAFYPLSRDHTLATILDRLGEVAEDKATSHRTISRFLTTGAELDWSRIDSFAPELSDELNLVPDDLHSRGLLVQPGDIFLLSTDGAHDEINHSLLLHLATTYADDPQRLAHAIVDNALEQLGRDNATVLVIRIEAR